MCNLKFFMFLLIFIVISIDASITNDTITIRVKKNTNKILKKYDDVESADDGVESQMLDLLGLAKRPKRMLKLPNSINSAQQFLFKVYDKLNEEEITTDGKQRVKRSTSNFITKLDQMEIESCNNIITFSGKSNNLKPKHGDNSMEIFFNTNDIPKDLVLNRAELRLYKKAAISNLATETIIQINIFPLTKSSSLPIFSNTTLSYDGWLEVDITESLNRWLISRKGQFGIYINFVPLLNAKDKIEDYTDFGFVNTFSDEQLKPFMIGYFNGPEITSKAKELHIKHEKNRVKRKVENHDYYYHKTQHFKAPKMCQKMNFSVDFKDLRWNDWIIAPEKFEAFFCSGECNFPLGAGMNATNHALVQTLMHLKRPNLPKPCCTPNVLSSISVLYYLNEDSVNLRKYRHMVAKSCGCH